MSENFSNNLVTGTNTDFLASSNFRKDPFGIFWIELYLIGCHHSTMIPLFSISPFIVYTILKLFQNIEFFRLDTSLIK